MTRLSGLLREHWSALESGTAAGAMRTTALPVVAEAGALLAGVDRLGRRHLLIPVAVASDITADTRSAAVQILPRRLVVDGIDRAFGDLTLLDEAFAEQFDLFLEQVLVGVERRPARPLAVARSVLDRWRALFAVGAVLSSSALVGLFGELLVLEELAAQKVGGVASWTGPTGTAQDFHGPGWALEIKSTIAPEGRTIRVHGADQLAEDGRELSLIWQRLEASAVGRSLNDLVHSLRELVEDQSRLQLLLGLVGYRTSDALAYDTPRFTLAERRCFVVNDAFPRITDASFPGGRAPHGVSDVHYTVDLNAVVAPSHDFNDLVSRLGGRT